MNKMKNITIVGVGALGSHLVPLLRNLDATVKVIDFDRVETKNTMSQFHAKSSIGKSKVQAIQATMQFMWSVKLKITPHKLTADNQEQLLGESDLLIDCLDNGPSRRLVQDYAKQNKIPCLHGALAADGSFGRIVWTEFFTIDEAPGVGTPTCENGEHLAFISTVASYLAQVTNTFLSTGNKLGYSIHVGGAVRT